MEIPKEELMQKHVTIGMRNKESMGGFIVVVEEDYIKLVDYDNAIIYVNPDAVAYIKVGTPGNPSMKKAQLKPDIKEINELPVDLAPVAGGAYLVGENPRPDLAAIVKNRPREPEFSMPMSQPDQNPCGSIPTFERKTKRGE